MSGYWRSPRLWVHLLVLRPLLRFVFGVTVVGKENLRDLDRFVLIANHNSHLDVLLLYTIVPVPHLVRTSAVVARDYFARFPRLVKVLEYLFRPVWVDRVQKDTDPVSEIIGRLDAGENIIIFPEGTRGDPGRLQEFKTGIGRVLAARREVPVVPVHLFGPERSFPRAAPVPLPLWNHVTVGPPQLVHGERHEITATLQQAITDIERTVSAGRHRRTERPRRTRLVAVLGIDGSGKSTLSRRVAEAVSVRGRVGWVGDTLTLFEGGAPQDLQPLQTERLREWMGQQAKQAKSLAHYKIPKLTELLLRDRVVEETRRWYAPVLTVTDGSPLLNMTAWAVLYREEHFTEEFCGRAVAIMSSRGERLGARDPLLKQFPELRVLLRLGLNRLSLPDAVLFLDVPPAVALDRIASRGERQQVHETEEKLTKLADAYRLLCRVLVEQYGVPTLRLDGRRPLEDVVAETIAFVAAAEGDG
jgi:1-acyl-sn-glycerol-3-phosphate acyltransferase